MGIEVSDTTLPGIIDDDDGGITFHREGLLSIEFPFGQPAPFLVHIEHRLYHCQLLARIEDGEEGMYIAVSIPEGVDGVSIVLRLTRCK